MGQLLNRRKNLKFGWKFFLRGNWGRLQKTIKSMGVGKVRVENRR
jgi:hypothetical protein